MTDCAPLTLKQGTHLVNLDNLPLRVPLKPGEKQKTIHEIVIEYPKGREPTGIE